MADEKGGWPNKTPRNPYTAPRERDRMGGGRYDAGVGPVGKMPTAEQMDRPPTSQGTFGRSGGRRGINEEIRKIQDTRD